LKGFALIYVVLLVALISTTIIAIGASSFASISIARKADETTQVRQVAQSGLEWGIVEQIVGHFTSCTTSMKFYINQSNPAEGEADVKVCSGSVESKAKFKNSYMGFRYDVSTGKVTQIGS